MGGLTNPLLDEINGLSPAAKSALMQAHQAGTSQAAVSAPPNPLIAAAKGPMQGAQMMANQPEPAPLTMPAPSAVQSVPSIGAPPQPHVKAPLGTSTGDMDERARLLSTGSGVDQIQGHPFLKGLAKAGDVIGSTIFPGLAKNIPGTTAHHDLLLKQNEGNVTADVGTEQKQAATAESQARVPFVQAETENLRNPPDKFQPLQTDEGTFSFDPHTGEAKQVKDEQGNPLSPKGPAPVIHETDQGIFLVNPVTNEVTPLTFNGKPLMPKQASKNTKEDIQRQILEASQKGDTGAVKTLQGQLKAIDPMGSERMNLTIRGQDLAGERAEKTADRQEVRLHDKTYVQPAETVEKSYEMMDHAYQEFENARRQGKQLPTGAQSMLALSTHLSTTFGNVKGARVTRDMIHEHLGARSIGDDALVAIQKLTNGDQLSPQQWTAFHDLIKQSRDLSWQTAIKEAARKNVPIDFLPPDLEKITKNGATYEIGQDGQYHLAAGGQ